MIRDRGRFDGGGNNKGDMGRTREAVDSFEGVLDLGLVKAVYVCSGLPYWEEGNPQEEDARSRAGMEHNMRPRPTYICPGDGMFVLQHWLSGPYLTRQQRRGNIFVSAIHGHW